MPESKKRFQWQIRCLLITAAIALVTVVFNLIIRAYTTENERITPGLANLGLYLTWLAPAVPVYLVYLLARNADPVLEGKSSTYRRLYWGGSIVFQVVISLVVIVGSILAHPDFLLGDEYIKKQAAPDGKHVAYLYKNTFMFCGVKLYKRKSWNVILVKKDSVMLKAKSEDCGKGVYIEWSDDSRGVFMVDKNGERVVSDSFGSGEGCAHHFRDQRVPLSTVVVLFLFVALVRIRRR